VAAENHLPDNRITRLALSTASQFEVMRHSRLRRTIGLPRHAGAARRAFLPYPVFRLRSSSFPTPLPVRPPALSPLIPRRRPILASPFCFIRNTSIPAIRLARVKSHPIPFSFRANNRASRSPARKRLLFLRFTAYPYSVLSFRYAPRVRGVNVTGSNGRVNHTSVRHRESLIYSQRLSAVRSIKLPSSTRSSMINLLISRVAI